MQIHLLFKIDIDLKPVGTYRISIFKCLIGKDNTLLVATCAENSHLVKHMLPKECILFNIFF